ncbi:hypothetical protein V8G54_017528 [Vigna mungo]|uniref:Uncharacterized protein n=1 Tax=Vigna mungo TaxID=3915 RepID=A0AAQ3NR32_VIGMU
MNKFLFVSISNRCKPYETGDMHSINIGIWFTSIVYTFCACNVITNPKNNHEKITAMIRVRPTKATRKTIKATFALLNSSRILSTNPDLMVPRLYLKILINLSPNQIPFSFTTRETVTPNNKNCKYNATFYRPTTSTINMIGQKSHSIEQGTTDLTQSTLMCTIQSQANNVKYKNNEVKYK